MPCSVCSDDPELGSQANKFKRTGSLAGQCHCCMLIFSLQVQVGVYVYVQHLSASAAFLSCRGHSGSGGRPQPRAHRGSGQAIPHGDANME